MQEEYTTELLSSFEHSDFLAHCVYLANDAQ